MPVTLYRYYYQSVGTPPTGGGPIGGTAFGPSVIATSPTFYWRLGEPSGTAAADAMGVQDGTYVNAPTLGVAGYASDDTAATFASASTQYVTIADHASMDIGTSDFSVMFALKMSAWPSTPDLYVPLMRGTGYSAGDWGFYCNYNFSDRFEFLIDGTEYSLQATTTLTNDAWHLIGISADRSGVATLTVDGVAEDTVDISAEVATSLTNGSTMRIGDAVSGDAAWLFDGSLDEVAIWTGTLIGESGFAALHAARAGAGGGGDPPDPVIDYVQTVLDLAPVAYYQMAEQSGTTMTDSSTTAQNGTYTNAPTLAQAGPFAGASGVYFDSTYSQYASAPENSALDFGAAEDFSIVLWFKMNVSGWPYGCIIGRSGNNTYNDYDLVTANIIFGSHLFNATETASVAADSSDQTGIDDGDWHMLALTMDRDGNATYYIDNATAGTTDISAYQHVLDASSPLYIARSATSDYETIYLSNVAIFDSLLSSGDIDDLWTAAGN